MKKRLILLVVLSLSALLSFTACAKKATVDGLNNVGNSEEKGVLYSSVNGALEGFIIWEGAGEVTDIKDGVYTKVLKIKENGIGWANIAFQNIATSVLTDYNQFEFKVKSVNSNKNMKIHLMGKEKAFDFTASSTSLGDDWYKVTLPFSELLGTSNNNGQVAFIIEGAGKEILLTDIKLSKGEVEVGNGGDTGGGTSTNLITNGDFSNGTTGWNLWANNADGNWTTGLQVVNGQVEISPTFVNGDWWATQFFQENINLVGKETGKYKLSFDAKADIETDMVIEFLVDGAGRTLPESSPFFNSQTYQVLFTLDTTTKTIEQEIELFGFTDSAKIKINFGFGGVNGNTSTKITMDNIKLEKIN